MAGMMGIDPALFEAASVDGATSTQIFYRITLPLLKPILLYVMITSLIGGLQMFDVPQVLTNGIGDPMRSSMTLIMYLNKHLYSKNYGNEKYPTTEKVSGNYEGEKVIRIYNERILKTDKAFYELMSYFDNDLNKRIITTVKINMLTRYYDEILTFTYKYVVLKDYIFIPINDVMENRVREYSDDYYLSGFNYMNEVRYEE